MDLRLGWINSHRAISDLAFNKMEREHRCAFYNYKGKSCPGCHLDQSHSNHERRLGGNPSNNQRQCGYPRRAEYCQSTDRRRSVVRKTRLFCSKNAAFSTMRPKMSLPPCPTTSTKSRDRSSAHSKSHKV